MFKISANILKMLNTGAGIFAWPENYSLWPFWGQDGSGEQCDKKAWRILHAGGVYYGKAATPRLTLVLAAKDLKLTIYDIG